MRFIRGFTADLTIVDTEKPHTVNKDNIKYKCKWSPFEGTTFSSSVTATFVSGKLAYNDNKINPNIRGMRFSLIDGLPLHHTKTS